MERPSGLKQAVRQGRLHSVCSLPYGLSGRTARKVSAPERRDCYPRSQLPRKRPLLQRGTQHMEYCYGQGAAAGLQGMISTDARPWVTSDSTISSRWSSSTFSVAARVWFSVRNRTTLGGCPHTSESS